MNNKFWGLVGMALVGIVLGVGPFSKGHSLIKSNNFDYVDKSSSSGDITFRGKKSCNIHNHHCTGKVDVDNDGYCDACEANGYKCHVVLHN